MALDNSHRGSETLQQIFTPGDLPCVGYFSAVMGAMPHMTEEFAGSGGRLTVHHPCAPNPNAGEQPWRDQFRDRLGQLPRPLLPVVFIKQCRDCGEWAMVSSATGAYSRCNRD